MKHESQYENSVPPYEVTTAGLRKVQTNNLLATFRCPKELITITKYLSSYAHSAVQKFKTLIFTIGVKQTLLGFELRAAPTLLTGAASGSSLWHCGSFPKRSLMLSTIYIRDFSFSVTLHHSTLRYIKQYSLSTS